MLVLGFSLQLTYQFFTYFKLPMSLAKTWLKQAVSDHSETEYLGPINKSVKSSYFLPPCLTPRQKIVIIKTQLFCVAVMTHNPSHRELYFPFQANRFSVLSIKNLNHSYSPVVCIRHGSLPKGNVKSSREVQCYITSQFFASAMFSLQFSNTVLWWLWFFFFS